MATITVDVDLEDFDDDEIIDEYNERGLGDKPSESERMDKLREIRQLMLQGKTEDAYKLMYDYIRDELGTAI